MSFLKKYLGICYFFEIYISIFVYDIKKLLIYQYKIDKSLIYIMKDLYNLCKNLYQIKKII